MGEVRRPKSAATVSLVPEARGGPFVFWDDLPGACRSAGRLGFDAIEIFAGGASALADANLENLLKDNGLRLAALGTGAGWVRHKLSLASPDASVRRKARDFIRGIIDLAGRFSAPAIIGSMQGRWGEGVDRKAALAWVAESLEELGEHASRYGVPLLFEPLNRYETNLVNTVADGLRLVTSLATLNVKLLCDLFHMNIEEVDIGAALRSAGRRLGHIHFVDSNRHPAGNGHIDYAPIVAALREISYNGYLSAEAVAWPDSQRAAQQTIDQYQRLFPSA